MAIRRDLRSNLPEFFGTSGWNPVREFSRMQRRMDRMFEEMMEPWTQSMGLLPTSQAGLLSEPLGYVPACEVHETSDHYLMSFDLPGVAKEDVKIEMRDREIIVSGERRRHEGSREVYKEERARPFGV